MQVKTDQCLSVVRLVLESGERLPCLVDSQSWQPKRVAMRWVVRHRRYRVQASTLSMNLRTIGQVYQWAQERMELDLDDYLCQGSRLEARQLESLAIYLREANRSKEKEVVSANTYNSRLKIAEAFLEWALYPTNRGGADVLGLAELEAERGQLKRVFDSLRMRGTPSRRVAPLSDDEVAAIRAVIEPQEGNGSKWSVPVNRYAPKMGLRNWLMIEIALTLGLRRGELLKLRLDCLPRGGGDGIKVLRYPDDPYDSRQTEPAVKTAERIIPASRALLQAIRVYVTQSPPLGRKKGVSPYLFVTRTGQPLAIDTAQDIIARIGHWSGVKPLSWHRLRHTWAEKVAVVLLDHPNGLDRLMYLGGWTHPHSPKRYIEDALAQQATQTLREYQAHLYPQIVEGEGNVANS